MPDSLSALRLALDPAEVLAAQGMAADPWQRRFLLSESPRTLLCCTRGGGKSRSTSAKALHRALFRPNSLILLISRAMRQSLELYRYVRDGYRALGRPVPTVKETETTLELENGSRIVSLPGKEGTIRSYQGVNLLIIDEAARVPDELYRSVRPMLGVSKGQLVALSTPFGKRGWFWEAWNAGKDWEKIRVTWEECPRLSPEFIATERADTGDSWVRQEYECSFESLSGVVYPDFAAQCCVEAAPPVSERSHKVGGIDFGFRDPFAAVWGRYDPHEDLLVIEGERYRRECGLAEHAANLPPGHFWECDPSGPQNIAELRKGGILARKAFNKIDAGIAAVRARIERGKLKVIGGACPDLLAEAQMYHYDPQRPGENPVDEYNHAMDALRYLVAKIDRGFLGHKRPGQPASLGEDHPTAKGKTAPPPGQKPPQPSMTDDGPHCPATG